MSPSQSPKQNQSKTHNRAGPTRRHKEGIELYRFLARKVTIDRRKFETSKNTWFSAVLDTLDLDSSEPWNDKKRKEARSMFCSKMKRTFPQVDSIEGLEEQVDKYLENRVRNKIRYNQRDDKKNKEMRGDQIACTDSGDHLIAGHNPPNSNPSTCTGFNDHRLVAGVPVATEQEESSEGVSVNAQNTGETSQTPETLSFLNETHHGPGSYLPVVTGDVNSEHAETCTDQQNEAHSVEPLSAESLFELYRSYLYLEGPAVSTNDNPNDQNNIETEAQIQPNPPFEVPQLQVSVQTPFHPIPKLDQFIQECPSFQCFDLVRSNTSNTTLSIPKGRYKISRVELPKPGCALRTNTRTVKDIIFVVRVPVTVKTTMNGRQVSGEFGPGHALEFPEGMPYSIEVKENAEIIVFEGEEKENHQSQSSEAGGAVNLHSQNPSTSRSDRVNNATKRPQLEDCPGYIPQPVQDLPQDSVLDIGGSYDVRHLSLAGTEYLQESCNYDTILIVLRGRSLDLHLINDVDEYDVAGVDKYLIPKGFSFDFKADKGTEIILLRDLGQSPPD